MVESSWNVMARGDAREGNWRGNWPVEWVASTLYTTSEHCVSSINTADAHTSAASSRLNWRPCRFKWTRPFRWKTKSGFCTCAITFQTQSTNHYVGNTACLYHIVRSYFHSSVICIIKRSSGYHSFVFSLRGRAGRNQSTVMWRAWLWHTASWASSWG